MITWRKPAGVDLAPPAVAVALLEQAVRKQPSRAALHLKLAQIHLDQYDFAAATDSLGRALAIDSNLLKARRRLAFCHNVLGRHEDALQALEPSSLAEHERAVALAQLGLWAEAEREWRAVLESCPEHWLALRQLSKRLRKTQRTAELVELCEDLHARNVHHAMLFYAWGTALALQGNDDRARALLFDHNRVAELELPLPNGYSELAHFNADLSEEILNNQNQLRNFPVEDHANRGSARVHALFNGRRPDLVATLLDLLQSLIGHWKPACHGPFDPWSDARPTVAHLNPWGLIQRGDAYEEWHLHSSGWLSGVYYVQIPKSVTAEGAGQGCIEFGPPTALARELPAYLPTWRHRPKAGTLLLAPSHYAHRTIPSGADEYRISLAFDVIPDGADQASLSDSAGIAGNQR